MFNSYQRHPLGMLTNSTMNLLTFQVVLVHLKYLFEERPAVAYYFEDLTCEDNS